MVVPFAASCSAPAISRPISVPESRACAAAAEIPCRSWPERAAKSRLEARAGRAKAAETAASKAAASAGCSAAPATACLGRKRAGAQRLFRSRTAVPCLRYLFRGAGGIGEGPGGRRPGHPQPRPQPFLSEDHLRRRLPERGLAQPLPVFLRLRQHQGQGEFGISLASRPRRGDGGDIRQDLAAAGGFGDALSCRSRNSRDNSAPAAGRD